MIIKPSFRRTQAADWVPGLQHHERTMRDVIDTLPGIQPSEIPWLVRFLENPASKWAFPGAITLARHDCVHVLLGRGLTAEDEAFVIGYTMGQSDGVDNHMSKLLRLLLRVRHPFISRAAIQVRLRTLQIVIFRFASRWLYPSAASFSASDLRVFDLGFGLGEQSQIRNMEKFPFENWQDATIGVLRAIFRINVRKIESLNRFEKILAPGRWSDRLDTDPNGIDHSHLVDPL